MEKLIMDKEEPEMTAQDIIQHGLSEQTIEQLVTYMRQLEREYDGVATALESKLHVLGINLNLSPKQELEKEEASMFAIPNLPKEKTEEWIQWDGTGFMPVQAGTLVDVVYRDGSQTLGVSAGFASGHEKFKILSGARNATHWTRDRFQRKDGDIIAYRLHRIVNVDPQGQWSY